MTPASDGTWNSGRDEGSFESSWIGRRRVTAENLERDRQIVLEEWLYHQEEERVLRSSYGRVLLWALIAQLALMDIILVLSLFGLCSIEPAALPYWLGALVIEVIGLVAVVAKGLFTNTTGDFHKLIASLLKRKRK